MAVNSLGRLTLDLAVKIKDFAAGMTQAERKTEESTNKLKVVVC